MKNKPLIISIAWLVFLFAMTGSGITKTLSTSQLPPRSSGCESNQQQSCWPNNMDIGVIVGDQYRNRNYKDHKGQYYNGPKDKDRIRQQQGNPGNNQQQNRVRTRSQKNYQN